VVLLFQKYQPSKGFAILPNGPQPSLLMLLVEPDQTNPSLSTTIVIVCFPPEATHVLKKDRASFQHLCFNTNFEQLLQPPLIVSTHSCILSNQTQKPNDKISSTS
ncbi:MAG: hypothetical protein K2Q09_02240, partial [Phycisphaerales bacterium]|nr:hypothetical protein [Phycisphaerales bacterium]